MLSLQNQEAFLVYGSYGLFTLFLLLGEYFKPAFPSRVTRWKRWPLNLGLFFINRAILQLVTTAYLANFAYIAWKNHWGLLNQLDLDPVLLFLISCLLLDFSGYFLHRLFHKYRFLWRIHRLHHSDPAVDISTAPRFHPLESLFSGAFDLAVIYLLGPSYFAVMAMELLTFLVALFVHANLYIPTRLDGLLRWVTTTPAMHHIHHSVEVEESDSNYSIIFPWWDRILGTYRQNPALPYGRLKMGVKEFESEKELNLFRMLALPFINKGR